MKLRRKLYSENNNPGFISKISKGIKNTARSVADKTKQGYNFIKTHTAKETASEVSKGMKKGSKAAWKYVKKNPDEAIVLTGSYAIPGVIATKLLKSGKTKQAALVGSIAAFPIGESYIAGKKSIQAYLKNKKKNDNKA